MKWHEGIRHCTCIITLNEFITCFSNPESTNFFHQILFSIFLGDCKIKCLFVSKSIRYKKLVAMLCSLFHFFHVICKISNFNTLSFQSFINKSIILSFFVLFLHVDCKILNSNMCTTKHLGQASCTELIL